MYIDEVIHSCNCVYTYITRKSVLTRHLRAREHEDKEAEKKNNKRTKQIKLLTKIYGI